MDDRLLSNSRAHGFKDVEYSVRKAPGVFRIFVLGDSLAYGQGVPMDETFSKVMETMLNRRSSSRVFEVINSSVPGMNAVQEYCLQARLGVEYRPDLFLLALCHNDAELHQPGDASNYAQHVERIWDVRGDTWPYFEESLRRMKATAESHGAKLVVAYFVFAEQSMAPKVPGILAETCQRLEIAFTDTGAPTARYPASRLWVNRVENHPNAFAHRVCAQHVVQFLDSGGLVPPEDPEADERALLRDFTDFCLGEDRALRSESMTFPVARLAALLQAKQDRRSLGQGRPGQLEKEEMDKALRLVSPLLGRAQLLECLDGYDTYLRMACMRGPLPLFDMKRMVIDLQDSIYYLGMIHRLRKLLPEMVPEADENPAAPDVAGVAKALAGLKELMDSLESLGRGVERCYTDSLVTCEVMSETECFLARPLAKAARRLAGAAMNAHRPVGLAWAEAARIGRVLKSMGEELSAQLEVSVTIVEEDFPDPDQFRRYRHFVAKTVESFLYSVAHLGCCLDELNIQGLAMTAGKLADGAAPPWEGRNVEVEVTILGTRRKDYSHLGVLWSDIIPLAAAKRDTMAIETDGTVHAYRYKFSAGVMAYFTLELLNCETEQLRSIRLHLNGRSVREWVGEDLQRVINSQLRSELLILNDNR
jgi:hypothetical protein